MVCPCVTSGLTMPADAERCRLVLIFHIDSCEVEGVDVSGLSVAVLVDSPQVMADGNWRVGMLMDAAASQEQAEKLGAVFSGQLGGPMAVLSGLITENLGIEVAPIEYADDGRRHRVQIGDLAEIEVEDFVPPQSPELDADHRPGDHLAVQRIRASVLSRGEKRALGTVLLGGLESNMEDDSSTSAFAPAVLKSWSQRKNLLPGLALVALAAGGWVYVAYQSSPVGTTKGMAMDGTGGGVIFLCGWTAMMVAMMVPATLPLILLYRTIAHNRLSSAQAQVGMVALLAGYVALWAATGMPVYAYAHYAEAAGSLARVLAASLLMVGGAYQFTPLKRICHARCSSPLFFLLKNWRPGAAGALRLGMVHGA